MLHPFGFLNDGHGEAFLEMRKSFTTNMMIKKQRLIEITVIYYMYLACHNKILYTMWLK